MMQKTLDCIGWIKNWFAENGNTSYAVIGISGGKDSTVVAALCTAALGADRVIGVLMPQGEQADINDSYRVVKHLGIHFTTVNIAPAVEAVTSGLWEIGELNDCARTNLPAQIRMVNLYTVARTMNGRVANTCNASENYIGWFTIYGDGAGDFAPLAQLTAREVRDIGIDLGLPGDLINKAPADGLCGQTDEDKFGFTYDELDDWIEHGILGANHQKIMDMHYRTKYKRNPMKEFNPHVY